MLVQNIKYNQEIKKIAKFLKKLKKLDKAYIAIPTRPPTETWAKSVSEETINQVYQVLTKDLGIKRVEYLIGYEGNAFAFTGDVVEDVLSITSVHPMRKESIKLILKKANSDWNVIEDLLNKKMLISLKYEGNTYYIRKFANKT
jgi:wyosine [tRNA(Phe)-imidazoG37] synthetase (radical SAM superfamily)